MTRHTQDQRAVKRGIGLEPSFPGSCSGIFPALWQIKISIYLLHKDVGKVKNKHPQTSIERISQCTLSF